MTADQARVAVKVISPLTPVVWIVPLIPTTRLVRLQATPVLRPTAPV
ncbi:hypothetical protein ABTX85_14130 [Streptomyces sp. NPDC096097]